MSTSTILDIYTKKVTTDYAGNPIQLSGINGASTYKNEAGDIVSQVIGFTGASKIQTANETVTDNFVNGWATGFDTNLDDPGKLTDKNSDSAFGVARSDTKYTKDALNFYNLMRDSKIKVAITADAKKFVAASVLGVAINDNDVTRYNNYSNTVDNTNSYETKNPKVDVITYTT